ncbi:hypothetical protein GOP47_0017394 [Adiantum capillus-veneris]|uniref:Uncharacterized protein n=1 Tax=Adiantum capillus-veneris TaxID=13818 RepID=A0A9D4ZBQ5_ADICA|nr:hypothetical protein GOP47_0017394 [Adiantum capillus-veneris]
MMLLAKNQSRKAKRKLELYMYVLADLGIVNLYRNLTFWTREFYERGLQTEADLPEAWKLRFCCGCVILFEKGYNGVEHSITI